MVVYRATRRYRRVKEEWRGEVVTNFAAAAARSPLLTVPPPHQPSDKTSTRWTGNTMLTLYPGYLYKLLNPPRDGRANSTRRNNFALGNGERRSRLLLDSPSSSRLLLVTKTCNHNAARCDLLPVERRNGGLVSPSYSFPFQDLTLFWELDDESLHRALSHSPIDWGWSLLPSKPLSMGANSANSLCGTYVWIWGSSSILIARLYIERCSRLLVFKV
ncbi:hypothetical protein R3P38DRAFT_2806347 [Favolaschia claudopus]|uniref:Uncharacterized protein n=1 Tax=Favolaschia claudopus TaxID=2862362 RepID=A0AAV9ZKK4_9AGAR